MLEQRRECEQHRLTFKLNGRQIAFRDPTDEALAWIDKFKEVGDIVANFDPIDAALPSAGVRPFLQIAVFEVKQRLAILVGVEKLSSTITGCSIFELLYLHSQSQDECELNLRSILIKLYVLIFTFLLTARGVNVRNNALKIAHAVVHFNEASAFVQKCEMLETHVAHDASLREEIHARERSENHSTEVDGLNKLLQTLEQPLDGTDLHFDTIFAVFQASKQSEILQWISLMPIEDTHLTAAIRQRRSRL